SFPLSAGLRSASTSIGRLAEPGSPTRSASDATRADVRLRRAGTAPCELANPCRCCPEASGPHAAGPGATRAPPRIVAERRRQGRLISRNDAHQAQLCRMRLLYCYLVT